MPQEIWIGDHNWRQHVSPVVDGVTVRRGLVPRDYTTHPMQAYPHAAALDMPLIPKSEWSDRIKQMEVEKSRLSDIRGSIPSRDQNGRGYCLPSRSLILMGDGSRKAIDAVRVNDMVFTAEGNVRQVKQCHVRPYDGEMVELWANERASISPLRCTPEHPVLTERGYVQAKDVAIHDRVCEVRSANRIWKDVIRIGRLKYYGHVFNVGVEDDNSYVAEGLGVHNCWMHSGTSAMLLVRATMNLPYVDLSAYMGACLIKQYQDEGGWGAQGVDWLVENGLPDSKYWPQQSVSRSNDTPEMRVNAKLHRFTEGWWDLSQAQYDRNMTFEQVATCLLSRIPVVVDFNWWSHSVCACDLVETSPGQFGIRIWNSWGDSWSDRGMGVLEGSKARPDGATAPRVTLAADR